MIELVKQAYLNVGNMFSLQKNGSINWTSYHQQFALSKNQTQNYNLKTSSSTCVGLLMISCLSLFS